MTSQRGIDPVVGDLTGNVGIVRARREPHLPPYLTMATKLGTSRVRLRVDDTGWASGPPSASDERETPSTTKPATARPSCRVRRATNARSSASS